MASEAQIQANRSNAQKSTGPRTDAGKAVVAQNAVKHGLRAEQVVIKGEDPGAFEFYRQQMLGELHPAGALESMLAERIVGLAWRLRRAERIQADVFDTMLDEDETDPVRKLTRSIRGRSAGEGASALGRVATRDFGHDRVLYRLGMYERRIEHSLYKTLSELQKLRLLRELDEPPRSADASVNAGGLGDGGTASERNHRQSFDQLRRGASLDAATQSTLELASRTEDGQLRQTNPIPPLSNSKTANTGENVRSSESERQREARRQSQSGPVWNATGGGRRAERVTAGVQYL